MATIAAPNFVAFSHTEAVHRVEQVTDGLYSLWWMKNQTNTTGGQPGFFFACGQIGGTGTSLWTQCVCDDPSQCQNCYRWWDATAVESLANRGLWLGDTQHADTARTLLAHAPYDARWTGPCAYMDDFGWYLLAYTRVYTWLGEAAFLETAERLFAWIDHKASDRTCGGVTWRACGKGEGCGCTKNSVTLLEILIGAARLAILRPEKKLYLSTAQQLWAWFHQMPVRGTSPLV